MTGVSGPSGADKSTTRTVPESSAEARSASALAELISSSRLRFAVHASDGGDPIPTAARAAPPLETKRGNMNLQRSRRPPLPPLRALAGEGRGEGRGGGRGDCDGPHPTLPPPSPASGR